MSKQNISAMWRAQGDSFDELALGGWLHAERMGKREWFVRVGAKSWTVCVDKNGNVTSMVEVDS